MKYKLYKDYGPEITMVIEFVTNGLNIQMTFLLFNPLLKIINIMFNIINIIFI